MTISRVKPAGWALNQKLSSAQMNAVDTNVTNALDKRQGETDTLSSTVTVDGYADITYQSGSVITHEADSTEIYNSDSGLYLHGLTDFDGFSAHNSGDVVNFYSGSLENHLSGSVDHYQSGSTLTYDSGSLINFNGNMAFLGIGVFGNGGILSFNSGSLMNNNSGSLMNNNSGSVHHYSAGAIMINDGYGEFADLRLLNSSIVTYKTPRSYIRGILPIADVDWILDDAGNNSRVFYQAQVNAVATGVSKAFLDLQTAGIPNGSTITQIEIFYNPDVGSHGALPVNLPQMKLIRKPIGNFSGSVLFTETTVAANVVAYEVAQTLIKSSLSVTLDYDQYSYYVIFRGEVGLNAEPGMLLHPFVISFTAPSMNNY